MSRIWRFNFWVHVETESPCFLRILLEVYNHFSEGQWEYTGLFNSPWWHMDKDSEKNPGELRHLLRYGPQVFRCKNLGLPTPTRVKCCCPF